MLYALLRDGPSEKLYDLPPGEHSNPPLTIHIVSGGVEDVVR